MSIEISPSEITKLMKFYPTIEELASWFNCSPDTIERRIKEFFNMTFKELRSKEFSSSTLLLKKIAFTKAIEDKDTKLLMYLLKTSTNLDKINKENDLDFSDNLFLNYKI